MLICTDNTIIEISPNQNISLDHVVDHPNLILIEDTNEEHNSTKISGTQQDNRAAKGGKRSPQEN